MTAHCQCDQTSTRDPSIEFMYNPVTEWPSVAHAPGQCQCTEDLQPYLRNDKTIMLCSCCHTFGDELLTPDLDQ